jgi:hypothetical protein
MFTVLEVVVAFVGLFLAFVVVRVPWFWSILECSLELVACSVVWLPSRCHGHFSFSKYLKPPEVFFELSFAKR